MLCIRTTHLLLLLVLSCCVCGCARHGLRGCPSVLPLRDLLLAAHPQRLCQRVVRGLLRAGREGALVEVAARMLSRLGACAACRGSALRDRSAEHRRRTQRLTRTGRHSRAAADSELQQQQTPAAQPTEAAHRRDTFHEPIGKGERRMSGACRCTRVRVVVLFDDGTHVHVCSCSSKSGTGVCRQKTGRGQLGGARTPLLACPITNVRSAASQCKGGQHSHAHLPL